MNKPIAITAGVAVGFIALALVITPQFSAYRSRGPAPKMEHDAAPAPSVLQTPQKLAEVKALKKSRSVPSWT